MYLNGGEEPEELSAAGVEAMQGGETIFWKTKTKQLCAVAPRRGMALLHAHGRRCLMHEAEEVRGRGPKYVLRADVMYRRKPRADADGDGAPVAAIKGLKLSRHSTRAGGPRGRA